VADDAAEYSQRILRTNYHTTILLAVEDITERRANERGVNELLYQKDVLLQELQHRVANAPRNWLLGIA
jgi:hypothetical protein